MYVNSEIIPHVYVLATSKMIEMNIHESLGYSNLFNHGVWSFTTLNRSR